ncbi:MAG: RagB/SusD family nutrient uptake outer membrane protein [Sphingobacteriales bacterium]|nr:RagB/SusD family nutrient uptake outer membrane protein [Sphingobacteriales bacterium]OJW03917.1 MAG: hypothetical protein BGO52_17360 [Sphingobacteriales bacterium 44-61]
MSITKYLSIVLILFCCAFLFSCKKFLDEKQNQSLVIPQTVQDLQSLLDNWYEINRNLPGAGETSSDDFFLKLSDWNFRPEYIKRTYAWQNDYLFETGSNNEWAVSYKSANIANTVLYYSDKIDISPNDESLLNNAKGTALFIRGISYLQVAWIWAEAYDESDAGSKLGIPLRLTPDFNTLSTRSTLKETYQQVLKDLKNAATLLPDEVTHVIRPSKSAAYGWIARTYLSMRNYDSAWLYSNKYLSSHSTLINFNTLNPLSNSPLEEFNKEVIYHSVLNNKVGASRARIDTLLYSSYNENDLRKSVFFRGNSDGTHRFKGSYVGLNDPGEWFNGIATDEMFLVRSECYARKGDIANALLDLNTLLVTRWKNNGTWANFTAGTASEAIDIILTERRKELLLRGLRWIDIKRLNKEGRNIILKRVLEPNNFMLQPNDFRYALPIPEDVIAISGMLQNPR